MKKTLYISILFLLLTAYKTEAESFRVMAVGELLVSSENQTGSSMNIAYNNSVIIRLDRETRFLSGIEIELSAPQRWLTHRGSLAMLLYDGLNKQPVIGVNDLEGRRIAYDPLPNKVKIIYQLPIRQSHGLRTSPYATVIANVAAPSSFPVLFRLMPIIKGISDELENMSFNLTARPILSDEGAVKLNFRYPEQLRGKSFTALINNTVVENISEEQVLREGEHHLVILSEDYRNESRRFIVEKAKVIELIINLQDPAPVLIFEAPENARIFLNNSPISRDSGPVTVEPGEHEARFQVGDYTLIRRLTVERGKTYRVSLSVGIDIEESE